MKNPIQLMRQVPLPRSSTGRARRLIDLLLIMLAGLGLPLSPLARAVTPPPDGGYPNANTAEGDNALFSLTTGADNSAVGFNSLFSNTTGNYNTTVGFYSLANNTTGSYNTGYGVFALQSNGDGMHNTAVGYSALFNNTTGYNNIALGANSGINLTTGTGNIDIGNPGVAAESKTIRLGNLKTHKATYIAGISGATIPGGIGVVIDSTGHLGTVTSSARYKDWIQPMDRASEAILALQPVTFRYKHEFDPKGVPQFGLVAEQVEKVNPDLVARDDDGKPYTVRYEAVNAMLLNEFLKEHRKVAELDRKEQKQEATIAQQQEVIEALIARLNAQELQIRKVSEQIEMSKSALPVVVNN